MKHKLFKLFAVAWDRLMGLLKMKHKLFKLFAIAPLVIAIGFLTTLPVRYPDRVSPTDQRRSLYWYPVVGLLIGLILWLLALVLPDRAWLSAGIIVAAWIGLTGALHLDGLADCADAWVGGLGDRERTLRILQDPNIGAIAVMVLIVVLTLKLLAIQTLLADGQMLFLVLLPAMARVSALILFVSTPYVRAEGIGAGLQVDPQADPKEQGLQYIIYSAVVIILLAGFGFKAIGIIICSVLLLGLIIRSATNRLGGFTGDVAGATIELLELAGCMFLVLMV